MLHSVYAVHGVNSLSWDEEIEREDIASYAVMMVELWTRKRDMGHEDETNVEDTSGYDKSWLRLG